MDQTITLNNRAVIIIPPIEDFYITLHRMSALGAKIVHRIICEAGFNAFLVDGSKTCSSPLQVPLPKALSYLKPHLIPNETGKCTYFTRFRHFGRPYGDIIEETAAVNPGLCFIGCFAFCYSMPAIELANQIKERCPQTTIIAGGAGVSVYPDYFLRNHSINYTLSGEAEAALPQFLEFVRNRGALPENVPNLGWKKGVERFYSPAGSITTEATLRPIIEKTDMDDRQIILTASLSRGCPSTCRFCSNHLAHGRRFRHSSIERFEAALRDIPDQSGNQPVSINFEDDNLLFDYPFLREATARCRRTFPNGRFTAENGFDYRLMTSAQCEALIEAGFSQFNFTLGSTSAAVLDRAERGIDVQRYDSLLSIAARRSIPVISYIICGFPEDTKKTIAGNLRFLMVRKTIIGVSLFYPVPGIAGFEDRGGFDKRSPQCCAGASAYPWGGNLDTMSLITAFRLARLINLMNATKHTDEERTLIERTIYTNRLHTIIKECGKRRIVEVPVQDAELAGMVLGNRH